MNFLVLTADYPPIEGGISTVAYQVSRELAGMGHAVTVVAPYFSGQEAFDAAEPVQVVRFRGYGLGWGRLAPMWWTARPHMAAADCVIAINASHGGVLAWMHRKRFITFAYAYEFLRFKRDGLPGRLLHKVYAAAERVISISRFTTENLEKFGVSAARIATVHPGAVIPEPRTQADLDAIRQRLVLDTEPIILAVGRFVSRKRHVTLVRALPAVLAQYPDALVVMVGQGPSQQAVAREAIALGVRDHVILPGRLSDDDVAALYQLCTLFALPTGADADGQVEGFGLVFTEAHAHGKPVVAGSSGGVVDAVLHEETGLLVEPDHPDALAAAILRLLDDPAYARRLGERGRARVEQELNWSAFSRRIVDVLEGGA